MVRIEKSIEIRAPPERVWEMLAFDKALEWMEGWKSVKYTSEVRISEDKYKVGASAHIAETDDEFDAEVTESLENEKLVYRAEVPKMLSVVTSILESVDEGTKYTHVVDFELPWGMFGKFLGRVMRGMGERMVEKSLEKLKSILEK